MSRAVEQLQPAQGGNIGFVSHGTAISIYAARVAGIDPIGLWTAMPMPAAVVIRGNAVDVISA